MIISCEWTSLLNGFERMKIGQKSETLVNGKIMTFFRLIRLYHRQLVFDISFELRILGL